MKLDAMSRQGFRSDLTSDQVGRKLETADIIAQQSDDSKTQVRRYIRLTHLVPELLDLMDEGKMALSVGVELSFLDEQSQYDVLEQCEINDCTPSYSQAVEMKKQFQDRQLSTYDIGEIIFHAALTTFGSYGRIFSMSSTALYDMGQPQHPVRVSP